MLEPRGLFRDDLRAQLAQMPLGQILAAALVAKDDPIEPAESYFTRPARKPAETGMTSTQNLLDRREKAARAARQLIPVSRFGNSDKEARRLSAILGRKIVPSSV